MAEEQADIDLSAIIGTAFSSGSGMIVIDPALTNKEIGRLIRTAIEASDGMPFTVIQSIGSVIFGDVKDLGSKFRDKNGSKIDR